MNDTDTIRAGIAAELLRAETARTGWNALYPKNPIPYPTSAAPLPVVTPEPSKPAVLSIRDDGACVPRDHLAYVEECEASDDPWLQRWAKEDGRPRLHCFMPEVAKYTGVSEYQAGQIISNCGRATFFVLMGGRQVDKRTGREEDDRTVATRPMAASKFVNGFHTTEIEDARAFHAPNDPGYAGSLLKDAAYAIREIARRWIQSEAPVGTFPTPGFGEH